MRKGASLLVGLLVFAVTSVALAAPAIVPYVGYLTSTAGAPVDDTVEVAVGIFADSSTGTALFAQTFDNVDVDEGVFSFALGSGGSEAALDTAWLSSDTLWLEFTVDGTKLSPRQQIGAVPFARIAGDSERLGGLEPADYLTVGGDVDLGSVSVGGTEIIDSAGGWVGDIAGLQGPPGPEGPPGPSGPSGTSSWTDGASVVSTTSDVGVGTNMPVAALDVDGGIRVGNDSGDCTTARAGTLRWTGTEFQGCTGSEWQSLGAPGGGATGGSTFTSHTFTPCGAEGYQGPALASCIVAYASSPGVGTALSMTTDGYQEWVVPETGLYSLVVAGARGGNEGAGNANQNQGGRGAVLEGQTTLAQGTVLVFLVGQVGSTDLSCTGTTGADGGGGGGTFVWVKGSTTPMIVAGGGGGASGAVDGADASLVASGTGDVSGSNSGGSGGNGANNGSFGAGGAGWLSDGRDNGTGNPADEIRDGTGIGGQMTGAGAMAHGGFGGGGHGGQTNNCGNSASSNDTDGGGGGGGYSGGAGTVNTPSVGGNNGSGGGGGGSFFGAGVSQTSSTATNTGDGYVIVSRL